MNTYNLRCEIEDVVEAIIRKLRLGTYVKLDT